MGTKKKAGKKKAAKTVKKKKKKKKKVAKKVAAKKTVAKSKAAQKTSKTKVPTAAPSGALGIPVGATKPLRPGVLWVNGTDLNQWAERLESQSVMPEVMRRLVHATLSNPNRVDFAAGEAVLLGGWDGIVQTETGSVHVPAGQSNWEIGTNKDSKKKADSDYAKRKECPGDGVDPAVTTFVFVTPRKWGGKDAWIAAKRKEGFWADVRAYDATDLEQWLELAPAVGAWLAHRLEKMLPGVISLSDFWHRWSTNTTPALPPGLVLARRTDSTPAVVTWISGQPAGLVVQGDTDEDALAFLAATVLSAPTTVQERALARTIIVSDATSWDLLAASRSPLILVSRLSTPGATASALQAGHHVFLPIGQGQATGGDVVRLGLPDLNAVTNVLEGTGLSRDEAQRLARQSGGSLAALRRQLQPPEVVHRPQWADGPDAVFLLPLLLVNGWSEDQEGDKAIVEQVAGQAYSSVDLQLAQWGGRPGSPIARNGRRWRWVSREDAWRFLALRLTPTLLNRWEEALIKVLGELDPRYDLPADDRWLAQMRGKRATYSHGLREGMAEALGLLACHSSSTAINDTVRPADRSAYLIRRLLFEKDWKTWASLSDHLRVLAEAAPNVFMECVERCVQSDPKALFDEEGLLGGSPQNGLVWALEILACAPEHLTAATVLLARLASVVPLESTVNRPLDSLREIFVLWHAQTGSSVAGRLSAIRRIVAITPAVGWGLLKRLMPDIGGGTATFTARPRWRSWPVPVGITNADYAQSLNGVSDLFLQTAGESTDRWCDVLEELGSLPPAHVKQALAGINELIMRKRISPEGSSVLWRKVRETLNHHRRFGGSRWSLPGPDLEELDALYSKLTPDDDFQKISWIFDANPKLPSGEAEEWDDEQRRVKGLREAAVADFLQRRPPSDLLVLAAQVEAPYPLGHAAVSVLQRPEGSPLLRDALSADKDSVRNFGLGLVSAAFESGGWGWVERCRTELGQTQLGVLALALPFARKVWDWLESAGAEAAAEYWRQASPWRLADQKDAEAACRAFLKSGRPYAALQVASSVIPRESKTPVQAPKAPVPLSAALVLEILTTAIRQDPRKEMPTPNIGMLGYRICELLRFLDEEGSTPAERVAELEWALIPLIVNERRPPRRLHEALSSDPQFFATVIEFMYRSQSERGQPQDEKPTPEQRSRAEAGRELVKSWDTLPGQLADGSLDATSLRQWVTAARAACAAKDRSWIGDYQIGELLSCASEDDPWPPTAVRDVIEDVASPAIEEGFYIAVLNQRGMIGKAYAEGGEQERRLASRFEGWAQSLQADWPRTAAALRQVVQHYEADAHREDLRARADALRL